MMLKDVSSTVFWHYGAVYWLAYNLRGWWYTYLAYKDRESSVLDPWLNNSNFIMEGQVNTPNNTVSSHHILHAM